jgi:hypothetical protein
MEEWKFVIGYEGMYEVSDLGNVRSLNRKIYGRGRKKKQMRHGHIMKQKTDKYGYLCVQLMKDCKRKHITVHRLVAIAFIANPKNKPQINHIDCNKKNNSVGNLEWNTAKENVAHSYKNGMSKSVKRGKHGKAKLVLDLTTGIYYDCGKDAAEAKGIKYSSFKESLLERRGKVNKTGLIYV